MKNLFILLSLFIVITNTYGQNNCLDFDGTNDYVEINAVSGEITSTFTIECWLQFVTTTSHKMIWAINDQNGINNQLVFGVRSDNKLCVWHYNGSVNTALTTGSTILNENFWYHVSVVVSGGNVNVYLDGVIEATASKFVTILGTDLFSIGQEWDGSNTSEEYKGKIDEFRVWNTARTETEIRQNMYQELNGNESGLVAYYKFNETSGTTANDETVNNNDGTLNNMDNSDWQTSSAMFGPKNCLDFDGTDDYVLLPNNLYTGNLQGGTEITIEYWFKGSQLYSPVRFQNEGYIVTGWSDPPQFIISSDGLTSGVEIGQDADIEDNKWHHIACVWKSNTVNGFQTYVDGVLSNQKTSANVTLPTISSGVVIGTFKHSTGIQEMLNGVLDEVRIWNTARTASEIRENMCKSLTGNESGLVAYYNFDNTSGNKLQDFSGNSNDGTLTNMDGSTDWISSSAFNTWLNTSSSSWSTASNWSLGSTPSTTDNVGIFDWSATAPAISGTPSVNNLFIGNNVCPTVNSNFSVSKNLILRGNLALINYIVDLGSTGQLIEDGGILCACSGHSDFCASLNNITCENIGGLGAEITCAANLGSTALKRYHYPIVGTTGDESIRRFYVIDPTNNSSLNATLVFHYDDSELNGNNESYLTLYKSEDEGQTWTEVGGTLNTTDNTLTLNNIDDFSWWTAAETSKSLPVHLLDFSGEYSSNSVIIQWRTATEKNSQNFIIQRSEDGIHFKDLQTIPAAGNSNQTQSYQITDKNVKQGKIYYYQLIENDWDGSTKNLGHISVSSNNSSDLFAIEKVYPNPVMNLLHLKLRQNTEGHLNLLDANGKTIKSIYISKGTTNCSLDMRPYPHGIYYIEFNQYEKKQRIKVMK